MKVQARNGSSPAAGASFAVERFDWSAPDRLDVVGVFHDLGNAPAGAPVLRLRGRDGTYELPAVVGGDEPAEGRRWSATFAWQETPAWFDAAEVAFGHDLLVVLPHPGPIEDTPALPPPGAEDEVPLDSVERLRLQAELVATQEQLRDARASLERAAEESRRAHADLEAERARHSADAERFVDGLASVRRSAEDALAAEHRAAERLRLELREARDEVEALRAQVSSLEGAAEAARGPAAEARTAAERLVARLAALERAFDRSE